ncbi:MAG TPA: hypothetical protein VNN19_05635 [bacterium]|nr:hypothetical protein [bacterium]
MAGGIQEVKKAHEARLLALPGVVSVGIGRGEGGEEVIVVCLDRRRPRTLAALPPSLEGFPLRVEITGPVRPLD